MQIFTIDNNEDIKKRCKQFGFKIKDFKPLQFVCESYETRNSWGHKGKVLYNNKDIGITYKIRYYNRTWESYRYQSLLLHLIRLAMSYLSHDTIDFTVVLILEGQEIKDIKQLNKKDFIIKYPFFTSKEYIETKKYILSKQGGEICSK